MKIGMIGAGHIGGTAAGLFAKAGHEVAISNSRGPETLTETIEELGPRARALTVDEAAEFGEVVMEAIPFGHFRELPTRPLHGKVFITAANYYPGRDGEIDFEGLTQSELVARHVGEARVVKAFNTIYWEHLRDQGDPTKPFDERRVVPLAGDDGDAKGVVAGLIQEIGFGPLDLGGLREGGKKMEPEQPIYNNDLTLAEARSLLGIET